MPRLSISEAWNETIDFLGRESRLIAPIALLLIALPGVAMLLATPDPDAPAGSGQAVVDFLLSVLSLLAMIVSAIAIAQLTLRPGASVGEALQVGLRRLLPLLGALLLVVLALMLVALALMLLFAGEVLASGAPFDPYAPPPEMIPVIIILSLLGFALWPRLMLTTPVTAAEASGPVRIIARSWRLTGPHYWKLLALELLLTVAAFIVIAAFTLSLGLVLVLLFGPPVVGSISWTVTGLFNILLQTLFSVILVVLAARIYARLTASPIADSPA